MKVLHMRAALIIPMLGGESQADTEDRVLENLEHLGIQLIAWDNTEIEDYEDGIIGTDTTSTV